VKSTITSARSASPSSSWSSCTGAGQEPAIAADLPERHRRPGRPSSPGIGDELEEQEAGVTAVEEPQPVAARLDFQLRQHRRQQHRLRLALGQAPTLWLHWVEPGQAPRPVELDLVFRTERGTPVNPNHASRAFARLAASAGVAAHPHLLRHALASAMAANKEPASIIAAQLRHADGGALAQRVYIHQLPQTAPRLAQVIEGVFGPEARDELVVSAGRRAEGKGRETRPSSST
jgi:hypothetical protein